MREHERDKQELPLARTEELVVQDMGEETVVYDLERDRAHCLNPTALAVWRRCDGKTPPAEISRALTREMRLPEDPRLVDLALDQLAKARLLETSVRQERVTRRDLGKDLGKVLAFSIPTVLTITAPTMASLISNSKLCTFRNGQCVPGEECYRCGNGCDKYCDPVTLNCVAARPASCPEHTSSAMRALKQRGGRRNRFRRER